MNFDICGSLASYSDNLPMSAIACTITEPPFFRRLTETQFGPIGALLGSFFITFLIKSQSMKMSSKFRPPSHCSANKLSQK